MAQVSNTYETYDAIGNREELADRIWLITPEETPFMKLVGREKVSSTNPEWQTDTLGAIDTSNNQPEGDDYSFGSISPTTRIGNYTQISNKRFVISRTQEKTSKAGRKSELAYETSKKSRELKRDMEAILLSNQASSAGSGDGATNRKLGAMRGWLSTNDSFGSGGGNVAVSGSSITAATNGTQRAFTKTLMDQVILDTYNAGGNPTTLMVSPYVKTVFSTFMDDANVAPFRYAASASKDNTIVATAEIYLSNFGEIKVVPNRQMALADTTSGTIARNAFLLDPSMVKVGIFDDIMLDKDLAKTGDATKRALVVEYTLCVKNEAAHGVVADLYGISASV